MKEAHIEVLRKGNKDETPGSFVVFDENKKKIFTCVSLELAWKNNAHEISCIPPNLYQWVKVPATAKIPYEHIAILNVPNRDGIRIHIANFAAGKRIDLLGCMTVGSGFADINDDAIPDIIGSTTTFNKLMAILPNSGSILIH